MMDEKYLNKYRIPSNRLQGWDYGNNGIYFITICTANRECFFGEVINGEMQLNELGRIANKLWLEIPKKFSFIELGEFVIMPNHIHGLLNVETQFIASVHMNDPASVQMNDPASVHMNDPASVHMNDPASVHMNKPMSAIVDNPGAMNLEPDAINCVSSVGGFAGNKNPLLNQNISRVIRWYKGCCTFEIRNIHADFSWQTRFYDHIVRNQKSLKNIEDYIEANPFNWLDDKFH